jgi:hypothetical protein
MTMAMTSDSDNDSHEKINQCNHPYTNTAEDKKKSTPANAGKIVKSYNGQKQATQKHDLK